MTLVKCFENSNVSNPKCVAKMNTSWSLSILERMLNIHACAVNKLKETIFMAVAKKRKKGISSSVLVLVSYSCGK